MTKVKIIDSGTVRDLVSLDELVEPMRDTLRRFSRGEVYQHARMTATPGGGNQVLIMPAATATTVGLKVLTMFPRAAQRGLPGVQGLVVLVDAVYGEPLAFMDGTVVTELRTAAVSAVATDALARPDATVLALIGAGVQGGAHLRALRGTRDWTDIRVHSRTPDKAGDLVRWAAANGLPARVAATASEAVAGADVLCTTTSACQPVLSAADVGPGTHVTAVGAFGAGCRELPTDVVVGATLFADSRDSVLSEAGDVLIPVREGRLADPAVTEIGEVLDGRHPGRTATDEITIVKSLGLPIEDVVACELVYRRAVEAGAGHDVDFG